MDSATSDIKNQPIVKSNNSLSKNTKMFILPPNVLQDIRISDSMVGGKFINYCNHLKLILILCNFCS